MSTYASSRLRPRKPKEDLEEDEIQVETKPKIRKRKSQVDVEDESHALINAKVARKNTKATKAPKKDIKKAHNAIVYDYNDNVLDFTRTCPNEIIIYILSFMTYKDVLLTTYDKRWAALGSSKEVWGMFCRRMQWSLPIKNKLVTYKDLFKKRICSKTFCTSCGCRTTAKFALFQITLCATCKRGQPEFATLNKTQSKEQYFLDDSDLAAIKHSVAHVGWGRKKHEYLKSEIIAAALHKYGGEAGLLKQRTSRAKIKQNRATTLALKKENRARTLESELRGSGWGKAFAVPPRNFPILLPSEMLEAYERFLRAPMKGSPIAAFCSLFKMTSNAKMRSGFHAMFVENMSLVDSIEAYLRRERGESNNNSNDNNNNNNTSSMPTQTTTTMATTTTTTTTTPILTPNAHDAETDAGQPKKEVKTGVDGRPLTTYAGVEFDAELRKFYIIIIHMRIQQLWENPGQFNIEPEITDEDDHMGVLFDKNAHFCKRLRTPNEVLAKVYADAMMIMMGDSDSDSDNYYSTDDDSIIPFPFFGGFGMPMWGDTSDSSDSDGSHDCEYCGRSHYHEEGLDGGDSDDSDDDDDDM